MTRQHVVLEHAALARQRHPGRADWYHQRLEFRHGARPHRLGLVGRL
jgi:hypothetical protein